jgi:hypothetical protein
MELTDYIKSLGDRNFALSQIEEGKIDAEVKALIEKLPGASWNERVSQAKVILTSQPVLEMELARPLPQDVADEIIGLARQVFEAKNIILDIKIVPQILGGARFYWQGRFFDGSLKTKLESHKGEIVELIRNIKK